MKKLLRNWLFPVGLIALWIFAAAYTLHALAIVRPTLQATEVPAMAGPPVATEVLNTAPPS
jgi:hypothetical protein